MLLVSVVNVAGRGCLERKYKSTLNGLMGGEQKWRETKKKNTHEGTGEQKTENRRRTSKQRLHFCSLEKVAKEVGV